MSLQVCTEHLLLGLVTEGTVKGAAAGAGEQRGCLAAIRMEAARAEVRRATQCKMTVSSPPLVEGATLSLQLRVQTMMCSKMTSRRCC